MKKIFPDFSFENNLWKQKYLVVGIDEVGRGALAGPLTIGATIFSNKMIATISNLGINDSKLLSPIKRLQFSTIIKKTCLFAKTVSIHTDKINSLGIIPAWKECVAHIVRL